MNSAEPTSPDTQAAKKRQLSVPTLAKAFIALVCLALIAVDARSIWRAYGASLKTAELSVQNVTRSIAQHAGDTIKKADTVLFGMAGDLELLGVTPEVVAKLQPLLAQRAAQLPEIQSFAIYDKNGIWMINSRGQTPNQLNNSDRDYFLYHKNGGTKQPHIGAPIRSRTTGDWVIPVSRRINMAGGAFGGVVVSTIRLEYFNTYLSTFSIGDEGAVLLVLEDGTILVRRPDHGTYTGQSVAKTPFFRDRVVREAEGVGDNLSDIDGIDRMVNFHRLQNYPLIAIVGISKHEVLANWRSETIRHVIGIALLMIAIVLMGRYLVMQIRVRARIWAQLVETQKKLIALNGELETLALQDSMTGLANRRQFDTALRSEFKRAMRKQNCLSLLMIDVDNFKRFNDEYGHPAGDRCLQTISGVIHLQRPGDLSARYGGEEFAILLPDTDLAGAIAVAQQIRTGIMTLQVAHRRNPGGVVTVSIGVATLTPSRGDNDAHALVQAADTALYAAKANGRNRVSPETALAEDGCPGNGKGAADPAAVTGSATGSANPAVKSRQ